MSKRATLAEATTKALKEIYEEFTGETRDLIGVNATRYFRELLDHESQKTLRDVVVDTAHFFGRQPVGTDSKWNPHRAQNDA